jgi:hypothetical protein
MMFLNNSRAALAITVSVVAGSALLFRAGNGPVPKEAAAHSVEQRRANPLDTMFIVRSWSIQGGPRALPEWFRGNRVQAHTRLSVRGMDEPQFSGAAAELKALGISVMTRHVKSGDESPWWRDRALPTPPEAGAARGDVAALVVRARASNALANALAASEEAGVKVLAYYWHMSDAAVARRNPEWVCRDAIGRVQEDARDGVFLDLTSGYREIILERLLELAALGADGFYFDADHMPHDGCFGTRLAADFTRLTGKPAPRRPNFIDPVYRGFLGYQGYRTAETFAYLQNAVQQKYPNTVFTVSMSSLPALGNPQATTDLARIVGAPKVEFMSALRPRSTRGVFDRNPQLPEPPAGVRIAFGWLMLRDAANGRPFHSWESTIESEAALMAYAGAVLAYGGIANINVSDAALGSSHSAAARRELAGLRDAARLGAAVSPYLASARPQRWAAVHWSELARGRRGGDLDAAWRETIWPALGAFAEMEKHGVPVGVVNDRQLDLGELDGYRVLFLPTPDELTPRQSAAVREFRARGGVVIEQGDAWKWDRPNGVAPAPFIARLEDQLGSAPVRFASNIDNVHAVTYTDAANRTLVAVAKDFSWVEATRTNRGSRRGSGPKTPAAPQRVDLVITRATAPRRAFDAVSGAPLTVTRGSGEFRISLPPSSEMALVVIE